MILVQGLQRLAGVAFDRLYVAGGRYGVYDQTAYVEQHRTPDARATGFDWGLYQVMASDRPRLDAYRRDIEALVAGKTVFEIGPGPHAALTSIAAEAGAASILSVEANAWAADQASQRVRRLGDRVQVVTSHTDDLSEHLEAGSPRHFDVLLLECYHAIASQERVVETVAALRRDGWSFDTVISKGFTTFVAPAAGPSSARMSPLERVVMGWPARQRAADTAMADRWSSLHGDMAEVAGRRLSEPAAWQWCDLEGDGLLHTATPLRFEVPRLESFAGFQFFNHFHFHTGDLDTGVTPTSWGVYYVPVDRDVVAGRVGPGEVLLTTTQPDDSQPSVVELVVTVADSVGATVRL